MNPVEEQLPPPPQPPQPNRISTSCDRHPDEHFTGFCPSCLCERLTVLDQSASSSSAATAGRKSASSAIKSIFRVSNNAAAERPSFRTRPGAFLPELRRTKSFSSGKNDAGFGFTGIFEPQRKSCDVRARNTLHSLFNQAAANSAKDGASSSSRVGIGAATDQLEGKFSDSKGIVIELNEEDEREPEIGPEDELVHRDQAESGEIEEIDEPIPCGNSNSNPKLSSEGEILKPMKDHLDLDSQNKKGGGKGGSFWSAASVLSKKVRSWAKKNNKLKKHSGGRTVQVSKKSNAGRICRETQSEVADYGFGRRSCDTDPRFSLDVGRMSLDYGRISLDAALDDPPRYSFDEPRASWDGYLIGGGGRSTTTFPRMPYMLSVVEGSPIAPPPPVAPPVAPDDGVPGGAAQTKDYYEDSSSSSRRRKSLDRSSSMRKTASAEMDELKPAKAVEYLHRDDCSESFDFGGNGDRKGAKKSKSWKSWNIWGLIAGRGANKDEDGVERSYSESWQELGRDPRLRSNTSVSWRNAYNMGGGPIGGSLRKSGVDAKKKSNEFVLERNPSARYSPNDLDNGLLRFYLTPMKGSRRVPTAKAKPPPPPYSHTIARSMVRMY